MNRQPQHPVVINGHPPTVHERGALDGTTADTTTADGTSTTETPIDT